MNEMYFKLFEEIAHTSEILAEQVMEYDNKKNDIQGEETARKMREDFASLYDKIRMNKELGRNDFIKLLLGAMVINNNIKEEIVRKQKVVDDYESNIIPKLGQIMNTTKTDEEALQLANEIFQLNN